MGNNRQVASQRTRLGPARRAFHGTRTTAKVAGVCDSSKLWPLGQLVGIHVRFLAERMSEASSSSDPLDQCSKRGTEPSLHNRPPDFLAHGYSYSYTWPPRDSAGPRESRGPLPPLPCTLLALERGWGLSPSRLCEWGQCLRFGGYPGDRSLVLIQHTDSSPLLWITVPLLLPRKINFRLV